MAKTATLSAKIRLIDEMSAKLDKIAQSGRDALSQWEQAGNAINTAFDGATVSTAQVAQSVDTSTDSAEKLSDALDKVNTSADPATDGVEKFGDENEEAAKKSEKFKDKTEETKDSLEELEQILVGAGIVQGIRAIGSAFVATIEDAIEFESAITGVYKTVDGTSEQLAEITQGVKDLSLEIPATTTEIAAVAEAAGQLGIQTDSILEFSKVMIDLGESTNLTSEEAATSLAKFANITQMSADEYERLGSTIVDLGNNLATTEADIVAMATRMASAGTLAGMTEAEILALSGALSSVGMEAEAGGSAMSRLISSMQLAVETGNEQLVQFAEVAGMTADEFSQAFGENAVDALYEFIAGLNDTERNGASATALLDEMGITEIRLSNAIKSLANNNEGLNEALAIANNAWDENTALATEADKRYATLESKLAMTKNAAANLSTEIGEVFTPTVAGAVDVGGDILNGLTEFVKNNPASVKAIASTVAGVVTFAGTLTGAIAVMKVAKTAMNALTAAAATNPWLVLTAAVAGLFVMVGTVNSELNNTGSELDSLTATSRKQANELAELERRYEETAELYGENSYEAWVLREQIDEMSAAYENSKQTVEEYNAELQNLIDTYHQSTEEYESATAKIDAEYESSTSLIAKLEELGSTSTLAARNQALIVPIIDELNSRYEGLGLTFDKLTGKFNMTAEDMQAIAKAEAEAAQAAADWERYVNLVGQHDAMKDGLEAAKTELSSLTDEFNAADEAFEDYTNSWAYWGEALSGAISGDITGSTMYNQLLIKASAAGQAMKDQQANVDGLQAEYDDLVSSMKALEEQYGWVTSASEESGEVFISYNDAVSYSLSAVQTEIENLCTSYDEAYVAARESIDGQIGLFQEMVVETETSVEEMMGAWESQILYLTSYSDNLKKAMDFGLDEGLVEQLSDGSEESMAYLDTIISKIEELGGTTDEAKEFIDQFNGKFQEVDAAKDEFSNTVADMQTNFSTEMEEMEKQLQQSIDNMNMETEAAKAAKDTMSGYISEITKGGDSAVTAAENAAARVRAALAGSSTSNESTTEYAYTSHGYADGTKSAAAGIALVGENGPELIDFNGGETVYTADETSRILAKASEKEFHTTANVESLGVERTSGKGGESKTIRLEINGSGALEVDSSMSEETVVSILYNHLKPVLTSIVKQEIYEEGDLAYDY